MFCEDFLKKTIQDDKGEWIGRVADFGFDPSNGFVRDMIFSGSFVEDMWIGRKRMPVLYQVEFSREFITIDKETREEITGLNKGLRQWLK
jgi:sporulation protein YlmC with PRC-barrel domain